MKNMIKKIAAITMAFTMLGTGTAVTTTIAPQLDNSITASAADVQLKVFSLFQNDAKDDHCYLKNSFKKGGCGPTSFAMVYRYYRGKYLDLYGLFDEMVKTGQKTKDGTSREGITERAAQYNIGVRWTRNCEDAIDAIKNGNPVIFNLKDDGSNDFTPIGSDGHYVVLSGYRIKNGNEQFFVDNPWMDNNTVKSGWFSKSRIKTIEKKSKNGTAYGICCDLNKNSAQSDILGFTIDGNKKLSGSNFKLTKGKPHTVEGLIYCKNNKMSKAEIEIKPNKGNNKSKTIKSTRKALQATKCISIGESALNTDLTFSDLGVGSHTMYIRAYNDSKQLVFSRQYSLSIY